MTLTSKTKRLDDVEVRLTPKEWAIRFADEMKKPEGDALKVIRSFKVWEALEKQAEEKYPGTKPEAVQARTRLSRELQTEFHALKKMTGKINEEIQKRAEVGGLEAALKISTLQTIILQDAFGRTARKAADWIELVKTEDKDDEENRQVMLNELGAFTHVDFSERISDSLPIGDIKIRFPTVIERWVRDAVVIIEDIFRHRAAVKIVQDKYFDGHPILLPQVEAGLQRTIHAVEDSVQSFNEYLDVRAKLFKVEWDEEDERQGGLTSAIPGEREGILKINLELIAGNAARGAKDLAKTWATDARDEAVFDIRQTTDGGDVAFEELAIKRGWIKP